MSLETRLAALAAALGADIGALEAAVGQPIVPITQADYDALTVPSAGTLYVIVDGPVSGQALQWESLTQAEYDALGTPNPSVLYIIDAS